MPAAEGIDGKTKVYGVIGNPIAHTFSPLIHNTLASLSGQNLVYNAFPVAEPDQIGAAILGAHALGIRGLNITVPYKSAVIPFLDDIDPVARAIGAVNTLVWTERGYKGYNTDYLGLQKALESHGIVFPAGTAEQKGTSAEPPIRVENVVIIGAGGAARAAGFMCGAAGITHLTILNRTVEKAQSLAADICALFPSMEIRVLPLQDAGRVQYDRYLAIQCTNVGLAPRIEEVPTTSATFYRRIQAAYDCIYNPEETKFLSYVHQRGKKGWCGIDMLLWQGIAAYELWTGLDISGETAAAVRERLVSFLHGGRKIRNYVLIGFMGSGKTTVGTELARQLSWEHMDTDALIVKNTKKSINQIFREQGEEGFRRLETETLKDLAKDQEHVVFSTGGGIVLQPENRPLLRELGCVVLLDVSPQVVLSRLGNDTSRPLLQGKDRLHRVSTLLNRRQEAYRASADLVVNVDKGTPEEIAREIIERTGGRKEQG